MSIVSSAPFHSVPLRLLAAAVLLSAAAPATHAAKSDKPPAAATAMATAAPAGVELAREMTLSAGKSALMRLPYPAARVAVGDARIADVILLNPSEIYMLGKATGATNLIVWNRANQATVIDITVGLDTAGLRQQFTELFPNERDIRITVSGNSLILHGTVADSVRAAQIVAVASAYLAKI